MSLVFKHIDLKLIEPEFNSPLTNHIIDLDHLRKKQLSGSTPPFVFFQLKSIFHMLESVSSARIEGNRTTIVEYIETKMDLRTAPTDKIREIQNMERAMTFIEETIKDNVINRAYISRIHKNVVEQLPVSLNGEGDKTPGEYRTENVKIGGSTLVPPEPTQVSDYMEELFKFINAPIEPKYDLLKTAIAHHRFVWIHPFTNGNGRTVRLFTYAMLIRLGFHVDIGGRILNPTAVFCADREKYYMLLALADEGTPPGMIKWCEYVLSGLKDEIEKIDRLLDYDYLFNKILVPAIAYSLERGHINKIEEQILHKAAEKKIIQAGDLKDIFPGKDPAQISRSIKNLKEKHMLGLLEGSKRKYIIRFDNNYLLRGIIKIFGDEGFCS
jgi:Fic family protein